MWEWVLVLGSAFWLGVLTSISPCPLASNVAAISFIARAAGKPKHVMRVAILYTIGRTAVYVSLGALLTGAFLSAPGLSSWLQIYMNRLMGPILMVTGAIILDLLPFTPKGHNISESFQKKIEKFGLLGALLLGAIFALAFCPVSAVLFFGNLMTLAVKTKSAVACPVAYGIGTAIPVVISGIALALGLNRLGSYFKNMTLFDLWARRITGTVFVAVGIWFTVKYTLLLI